MALIGRRDFFVKVVAAASFATFPAIRTHATNGLILKYGNNLPLSHPLNLRSHEAADRIKAESNGEVELHIFPNNQLGGDTDMLSQVRSGALDFFTPSALVLAPLVPVAPINAMGFAFTSYEQVWAAMDGELGAFVQSAIEKAGLHLLEKIWDNGFRQITTSSKPIDTPRDLLGVRIRVPVSLLGASLFQALAASPTSLQFNEVYTALQTHMVDAQENPLPIIQTAKLYEVQKFVSLTNHIWDGFLFVASGKTWSRLPGDIRALVARVINEAGLRQREDVATLNQMAQSELQKRGMIFNRPDPKPFRDALRKAGFYAQWKEKFGPDAWSLLEKYVGQLI